MQFQQLAVIGLIANDLMLTFNLLFLKFAELLIVL